MEVVAVGLGEAYAVSVIGEEGLPTVVVGAGGDATEEWVAGAREGG